MKLKLCNNGLSVYGTNAQGFNVSYNIEAEEYKEWLAEGNIPEPEFTELEIIAQDEAIFRTKRNALLAKVDIEINKAEDLGLSSLLLRQYRQALRDATMLWVMPEYIVA